MTTLTKAALDKSADSLAGLRFLVVDDHKFSRQITIEALKWLNGTKITEAVDATDAIALLQDAASYDRGNAASSEMAKRLELSDDRLFGQGKIDCVITDFNMSPLNGLHLLKSIRTGKAKCPRDIPVLMLTGFSDDHLIAASLDLDINAFVLKPISRVKLGETLRRVLMRPITLKGEDAYEAIAVPECDDLKAFQTDATPRKSEGKDDAEPELPEELKGRSVQSIRLTQLLARDPKFGVAFLGEDIVIGEDVKDPSGAVFLHRGTKLSTYLLEKLQKLQEMGMLPEELKVFE
jgi:CheY-like chemotaxis protein